MSKTANNELKNQLYNLSDFWKDFAFTPFVAYRESSLVLFVSINSSHYAIPVLMVASSLVAAVGGTSGHPKLKQNLSDLFAHVPNNESLQTQYTKYQWH